MNLEIRFNVDDTETGVQFARRIAESHGAQLVSVCGSDNSLLLSPVVPVETGETTENVPSEQAENVEPVLGTGSLKFGDKKAKEMRPSEFLAFGEEGAQYLSWLLGKLEESLEDPRAQQSPRYETNKNLIPYIRETLNKF